MLAAINMQKVLVVDSVPYEVPQGTAPRSSGDADARSMRQPDWLGPGELAGLPYVDRGVAPSGRRIRPRTPAPPSLVMAIGLQMALALP